MATPADPRWQPACQLSRFLSRLLEARPTLPAALAASWERALSEDQLRSRLQPAAEGEESLKRQLRELRQWTLAHLALRDLAADAPLAEIVEGMTLLADVTTNSALDTVHRELVTQFGEPLDSQGRPQRLMVIGMGKLGGRELNVSSDVDYIFIYPEDGETAGPRKVDNFDFFTRLGKRLIGALGEVTGDGQVFRVDMRLRPNGDSGPLVCSIDALENYFITQGREWERYAWIKARVMNTGDNEQAEWMAALKRVVQPFVFRKYLDFGAINAMRDLHAQIRREVARKEMAEHIKLGPGGIREIEFIAQVFQLIRGGRDTALQVRPTLSVLQRLVDRRLIPAETAAELRDAYLFLRRLEHRLQWIEDQQTHVLPKNDPDRESVALAMGFSDWPGLLTALDLHRQHVARHFDEVFSAPEEGSNDLGGLWLGQGDSDLRLEQLRERGFREPEQALSRLADFISSARYQQLPARNRERLDAVGPRLIEAAAATPDPDLTLSRGLRFLETISRRGAYLALLQQYPLALKRVADLVGASSWATDYLNRHPLLLDEFLDPGLMEAGSDWSQFREDLVRNLGDHAGDTEREMDILREMHHGQVFRLLTQDLAGVQSIEHISDHLSELADIMVQQTLSLCWSKIPKRHREQPAFAVIGYGKLGGKELGYASDLDIVFIYDDEAPDAQENYTRLGQRINTWLSSQTAAGMLFETDLRLRPNGDSGLLVVSLESFREYQEKNAWVWEHQALTRARFCAGDSALGQRFDVIRENILRLPRDLTTLKAEVLAMRKKMLDSRTAHEAGEFDIKHDPGGIIDVEFIIQYLVLGHAAAHPELTANIGNLALLSLAAKLGLIPGKLAEATRIAYREYRRLQHLKRLNDQPAARIAAAGVIDHTQAVQSLWHYVFD